MTPLLKPVTRVSHGEYRGRKMVVTLAPGDLIQVRHLGTRDSYEMPLSWVYDAAVKATAFAKMAERRKAS